MIVLGKAQSMALGCCENFRWGPLITVRIAVPFGNLNAGGPEEVISEDVGTQHAPTELAAGVM